MQVKAATLIDEMILRTQQVIRQAQTLQGLSTDDLARQPAPGSWSALQCMEHLNRYGNYYLPEIRHRMSLYIKEHRALPDNDGRLFRSGLIGNYFVNMIMVKQGHIRKIKTMKSADPIHEVVLPNAIETFLRQQQQMLDLLDIARSVDLVRTKTSVSVSSLVHIRLGDTFRFVIHHNERHILQAYHAVDLEITVGELALA